MAGAYDRSRKVSQSTIDEIKKLGMDEAIKKANSGGASGEFVEAARRFYGGNRVTGTAPGRNTTQSGSRGQGESEKPSGNTVKENQNVHKTQPISSTKPTKAAVERRLQADKGGKSSVPGLSKRNVEDIKKATAPVVKVVKKTTDDKGIAKGSTKVALKAADDFWDKNIGRSLSRMFGR